MRPLAHPGTEHGTTDDRGGLQSCSEPEREPPVLGSVTLPTQLMHVTGGEQWGVGLQGGHLQSGTSGHQQGVRKIVPDAGAALTVPILPSLWRPPSDPEVPYGELRVLYEGESLSGVAVGSICVTLVWVEVPKNDKRNLSRTTIRHA